MLGAEGEPHPGRGGATGEGAPSKGTSGNNGNILDLQDALVARQPRATCGLSS